MEKSKKEKRQGYFFDNKALLALILPLVVEHCLKSCVKRKKVVPLPRFKLPCDGKLSSVT